MVSAGPAGSIQAMERPRLHAGPIAGAHPRQRRSAWHGASHSQDHRCGASDISRPQRAKAGRRRERRIHDRWVRFWEDSHPGASIRLARRRAARRPGDTPECDVVGSARQGRARCKVSGGINRRASNPPCGEPTECGRSSPNCGIAHVGRARQSADVAGQDEEARPGLPEDLIRMSFGTFVSRELADECHRFLKETRRAVERRAGQRRSDQASPGAANRDDGLRGADAQQPRPDST
jgi:hypothetical protein